MDVPATRNHHESVRVEGLAEAVDDLCSTSPHR